MRTLLILSLTVALPAAAAAAPELKCNFEGNKTTVLIVNPDAQDKQCNYACHYRLEGGSASVSGATTVKAGETKTVDEDTRRSKVSAVRESSLKCE